MSNNPFKVGDRVRIDSGSQFSHQSAADGTVLEVRTLDNWCIVKFDDGYQNSYPQSALILVSGKKSAALVDKYILKRGSSFEVFKSLADVRARIKELISEGNGYKSMTWYEIAKTGTVEISAQLVSGFDEVTDAPKRKRGRPRKTA